MITLIGTCQPIRNAYSRVHLHVTYQSESEYLTVRQLQQYLQANIHHTHTDWLDKKMKFLKMSNYLDLKFFDSFF